ncbi:MAG: glutamine--fructose-6-phosphate transaminase (isomerizing) [Leptospiraceae bacterium]|nr:glutamine--fructose-6-phosphate transaminase (isomerizing) [Leptospiraceae bacterium]MCP5513337.1 glutamine--fructose-6-phosphate transaminase (isomerizing) [Leptospiraceae bacterium]
MCGIVGYIGPKLADAVLLFGLYRLEYRGYDSAGIAVIDDGEIEIRKDTGKIRNLERLLKEHPVEGNVGIGHTRWATHGAPTSVNAHPHADASKSIAVVHNGIIENYDQIRKDLQSKNFLFVSDTDTEVIPQLLKSNNFSKDEEYDIFKTTISKLEGRFAFLILVEDKPDRVFFCRNGSPLVYGRSENEGFLVSDSSAFIASVKEQYFVKDGEWGWITREGIVLFDKDGNRKEPELIEVDHDLTQYEKNGYEHFMLKEIFEQPTVVRNILDKRIGANNLINFSELTMSKDFQAKLFRIVFTSAGTSLHAAMIGKLYIEKFAKIMTEVEFSSEFRYRNPILEGDTLVIAISQSGETADTLASIHSAKAKFLKVLSFVNQINSSISRESTAAANLFAGTEIGVASTKAYVAELVSLLLYSLHLAKLKWILTDEEISVILEEVKKLPKQIEQILEKADSIKEIAYTMRDKRDFIFLGRSYEHPTALEGALKLKEISYAHASGYAGGEFKHGPIALVSKDVPVICITPKSEVYTKMVSNLEEVRARNGIIFSIHTEGDESVPALSNYSFAIPDCSEYITPILSVIPLQLFAYYVAIAKGCEPDQPRNLAKSVTVE